MKEEVTLGPRSGGSAHICVQDSKIRGKSIEIPYWRISHPVFSNGAISLVSKQGEVRKPSLRICVLNWSLRAILKKHLIWQKGIETRKQAASGGCQRRHRDTLCFLRQKGGKKEEFTHVAQKPGTGGQEEDRGQGGIWRSNLPRSAPFNHLELSTKDSPVSFDQKRWG